VASKRKTSFVAGNWPRGWAVFLGWYGVEWEKGELRESYKGTHTDTRAQRKAKAAREENRR